MNIIIYIHGAINEEINKLRLVARLKICNFQRIMDGNVKKRKTQLFVDFQFV